MVVFSSPSAGTVTINASVSLTVGGLTLTRDTDPLTLAGAGPGGTGPATKVFKDGTLRWLKFGPDGTTPLAGAKFAVCRTHTYSSASDSMPRLTMRR